MSVDNPQPITFLIRANYLGPTGHVPTMVEMKDVMQVRIRELFDETWGWELTHIDAAPALPEKKE